ncbi:MAG: PilN domain-containing protein [Pseudohongiellaceae bacterium]
MANINLLPWRERRREARKQQFFVSLALAAGLAGLLLFGADRVLVSQIGNQYARNRYLTDQIALLDQEIAEIRQLQQQKKDLAIRMAVIRDLHGKRPVIVHLFDELVRTLPEGVFYDSITRTEDSISIVGSAESNSRVSALMRSLDDSEWFANPDLRQVTAEAGATGSGGSRRNRFQLTVSITTPASTTAGAEAVR